MKQELEKVLILCALLAPVTIAMLFVLRTALSSRLAVTDPLRRWGLRVSVAGGLAGSGLAAVLLNSRTGDGTIGAGPFALDLVALAAAILVSLGLAQLSDWMFRRLRGGPLAAALGVVPLVVASLFLLLHIRSIGVTVTPADPSPEAPRTTTGAQVDRNEARAQKLLQRALRGGRRRPRKELDDDFGPGGAHPAGIPITNRASVEVVASGLRMATSITADSKGRLIVAELRGRLLMFEPNRDRVFEMRSFAEVLIPPEAWRAQGLWTAKLDPEEGFLYVMAIESVNPDPDLIGRLVGGYTSRLSRFRYDDGEAGPLETILSGLPAGSQHPGGAFTFGPDGHLYLTIGDATTEWLAYVPRSLVGSILRLTPAGSVPEDNPFRSSLVYAYGFRNPFGIAFHPRTGMLYVTDNGPDCCDRLLRVERGGFHGWPLYGLHPSDLQRAQEDPKVVPPLIDSGSARIAPTQLIAYGGDRYGREFDGNLFFGTFRDGTVRRVVLSDDGRSPVSDEIVWASDPREGVTGLTVAPDGHIYFTTPANLYRINVSDRTSPCFPLP